MHHDTDRDRPKEPPSQPTQPGAGQQGQRGAGITNRPLDEEDREQEELPERGSTKSER